MNEDSSHSTVEGEDKVQLWPSLEDQRYLLQSGSEEDHAREEAQQDDIQDAALFSADILRAYNLIYVPQHGLLGAISIVGQTTWSSIMEKDSANRLVQNISMSFSVFVCGLQGSRKPHTLSCLIGEILHRTISLVC